MPRRAKEHPPTGYTGRAGKFADADDLAAWLADSKYREGNIAIRVGNVLEIDGARMEVIGIDVDHYGDKRGGDELKQLEEKLGVLPQTWCSTARSDGVSGIRFFLVPHGFGYKGKAGEAIDIVQRVHRYAVVYPSWHPDTKRQYFWYEPGKPLDGQQVSDTIPDARDLAVLPDAWVEFLTAGRQLDDDGYGIDLDSSNADLKAWIKKNFPKDLPDRAFGMCPLMERAVASHIKKIENSSSNHDKLVGAHWHLITLAAEGHSGLRAALAQVEEAWFNDIVAKGNKRHSVSAIKREIARSKWGTFRKIKAKADGFAALGFSFFSTELCVMDDRPMPKIISGSGSDSGAEPWIYSVPLRRKEIDAADYDNNDVSQAQHFIDRVGDNVRYLADYNAWIIYDGKRWHIDSYGLIRDLFDRAVIKANYGAAKRLSVKMGEYLKKPGTHDTDVEYKKMEATMGRLMKIADRYRNDARIKAMLNCAKSIPGVGMKYNELNWDTTILAMPGGKCLQLEEPRSKANPNAVGYKIIKNQKRFYTTMSTAVDFVPAQQVSDHEVELWKGYLDLFLPADSVDEKGEPVYRYRKFVQKALGYTLIGGNPEKLAIFMVGIPNTGKSTMLRAIQETLGDYAATFQPNSIFRDNRDTNPELGNLLHKRLIGSSESGSQRIYANPFKRNTGGDEISVTRKYANEQITGIPHFVPVIATNQPPTIEDADEALVKRIMVLPFNTQVSGNKNDKRADVIVPRDARHAIFRWIVKGFQMYVREGLDYSTWPDVVKAATLEFASELSDVSAFVNEVCEVADSDLKNYLMKDIISDRHNRLREEWGGVSTNGLYMRYAASCHESGQTPMAPNIFGKKLNQLFGITSVVKKKQGKPVRYYLGLKYKEGQEISEIRSV